MTNLLSRVATMIDGAANLSLWLGSGGICVSQEEAQSRADICNTSGPILDENGIKLAPTGGPCPLNKEGSNVTKEVALATKKFLEFKNDLSLKVEGEKKLKHCAGCSCVLRLMTWEPSERIAKQMTPEEYELSPQPCWKRKAYESSKL